MIRKLLLTSVALLPATPVFAQDRPFNPYAALDVNPWMGGNLWGAAQVIRAQGVAAKHFQEAKILKEEAKQKALETKRKQIEHTKWELENKPYEADFEKRRQEESFRMQMIGARPSDILSGYALNTLRRRMEPQFSALDSDVTPLPELLQNGGLARRINFSDGTGNSSSGLLLIDKINWQGLLQEDVFAADRQAVESLMAQARTAAETGKSTYSIQKNLKRRLDLMEDRRFSMMKADQEKHCVEVLPQMYAMQQIKQLKESVDFLNKGNLSETIFMKKNIDAPTIGKLVFRMRERGWQFAAATDGNEAVYTALYNSMKEAIDKGHFQ